MPDASAFPWSTDAVADALYVIDRATLRFVHVNEAACRLHGLERGLLLTCEPWTVLSGSRAALEANCDALIGNHGPPVREEGLLERTPAGAPVRLEIHRHAQRVGGRWAIIVTARNITDLKDAQDKVIRLNRLYAMVSGINALVLRSTVREALFSGACRIAVELGEFTTAWIGLLGDGGTRLVPVATFGMAEGTGAELRQAYEAPVDALRGEDPVARALMERTAMISDAAAGNAVQRVFPLNVADAAIGVLVLHTTKSEYFDAAGTRLLLEVTDNVAFALSHIDQKERLEYLAYYDALTGLANRRLFLDRVGQHLRAASQNGHKLALFYIDLERFKSVNDSLGRTAGDSLLRQVATWLTLHAGNVNDLARVGADQFAVVVPRVREEDEAIHLLEDTVSRFLEHGFILNDRVYRTAAKIGVVLYPDDGTDADTLFRHAEAATKKAKASGDRYLQYAQKMSETVTGSLGLENQLRQALERNEFVLHYQPKVNIHTGSLTGAEALIRWNSPDLGLVPPGRFIPLLEQTGMIREVGRWALAEAIDEHLRWLSAGLPAPPIAVNVSPLQLRDRRFVTEVERAIRVDPRAPSGLQLEITEGVIMEDIDQRIHSLQAIRSMGVSIAIDDFGTGFSSLSYLAKLPVDTLKIDRSFIAEMTTGPSGITLVSVIIKLAHALKLNVVAEGVETQDQLRRLRSLKCDEMQGFLFGRAIPGAQFAERYLVPTGTERLSGTPDIHAQVGENPPIQVIYRP